MSLLKKRCKKTPDCKCYGIAMVRDTIEIHYCNGLITRTARPTGVAQLYLLGIA